MSAASQLRSTLQPDGPLIGAQIARIRAAEAVVYAIGFDRAGHKEVA